MINQRVVWTLVLAFACLLPFANGLTAEFTYDDKAIVRDNPRIRRPAGFPQILETGYFGRPKGAGTNYRPVLLASYAVQWWIHGGRAVSFRIVNVLLHAVVAAMLVRFLLAAGLTEPLAQGAGVLFAVHPIHVEAVTSIVGRAETLAALFALLFVRWTAQVAPGGRWRALRYAAGFLCLFLGILTKESAAVAPLLAMLLLYARAEGGPWARLRASFRRGAVLLAGSALALAGVLLLRARVIGGFLKGNTAIFALENPLAPLPFLDRAINGSAILFRYLGRCVAPLLLTADESAWSLPLLRAEDPAAYVWPLLLFALAAAAIRAMPRVPGLAFGFLLFVAAFAVTANILFPIGTVFAERLAYLPSAGVCLMLAWVILGTAPRWTAITAGRLAALAAVTVLFGARTAVRNVVWQDDLTLFSNLVATSPASAKSHYNRAYVLADQRAHEESLAEYTRATRIYPGYFDAWAGKGRMELELGHPALAEESYLQSLRAQPGYENGYFGLGRVREARGGWRGAEAAYVEGLRSLPRSLPLLYRLAIVRTRLSPATAGEDWLRAVAVSPFAANVRMGYADWLLSRGRRREAERQAREILRRTPGYAPAHAFLADRREEEGRHFAEGLARERVFLATRRREDLLRVTAAARRSPAYRARYDTLRPRLERLAPWAFPAAVR
ncbi:MAG: tetratricopeptide repeat protein [Thermoanaerobaculia bacterium]